MLALMLLSGWIGYWLRGFEVEELMISDWRRRALQAAALRSDSSSARFFRNPFAKVDEWLARDWSGDPNQESTLERQLSFFEDE